MGNHSCRTVSYLCDILSSCSAQTLLIYVYKNRDKAAYSVLCALFLIFLLYNHCYTILEAIEKEQNKSSEYEERR
jgi:hypothetical protein